MDRTEQMAADIAVKLNGGEWSDGKWYSQGHRDAWIKAVKPYADEIERLQGEVMAWWKETEIMRSDLAIYSEQIERQQKALQWIAGCEGGDIFDMCKEMRDTAKAALKEGK